MTGPRNARAHPPHDGDLVIRLPNPRLLRLVARSVLVAAAVLSFPWLRADLPDCAAAASPDPSPPAVAEGDALPLLILLADLRRHGLLHPGDRAVSLGTPRSGLPFLKRSHVDPIADRCKLAVPDRAVDFVLAANGSADPDFGFVERVLKVGGMVAVALGNEQCQMPRNYRIAYIRRFGTTFVAMKKIAHASANADGSAGLHAGRRLLAAPAPKKEASMQVFVDMHSAGNAKTTWWNYLARNQEVAITCLNVMWMKEEFAVEVVAAEGAEVLMDKLFSECHGQREKGLKGVRKIGYERFSPTVLSTKKIVRVSTNAADFTGVHTARWLLEAPDRLRGASVQVNVMLNTRNADEDKYVAVMVEADGVEMLMDELFLERSNHPWEKLLWMSMRGYRECLALYGKLSYEWFAAFLHLWG